MGGPILLVCFFLNHTKLAASAEKTLPIQSIQKHIDIGDWIVREGRGYESVLIKTMSRSEYSHIGVILQTQPEILIVHATTDDDPQRLNQVLVSSLQSFVDPRYANKWAVFRDETLTEYQRKKIALNLFEQRGQPFILDTRNQLHRYCSSVIAEQLPIDRQNVLRWSQVDFPGMYGELLFPIALLELGGVRQVYSADQ